MGKVNTRFSIEKQREDFSAILSSSFDLLQFHPPLAIRKVILHNFLVPLSFIQTHFRFPVPILINYYFERLSSQSALL